MLKPCSRTIYPTRTDCVLSRINLSTWVLVEFQQNTNLSLSEIGSTLKLLWHLVLCCLVHHIPLYLRTHDYKDCCLDNEHIHKCSVTWKTWTLHQISNIARFSFVKWETFLVYIYQLELYQLMKSNNMFRVGIPPPEK